MAYRQRHRGTTKQRGYSGRHQSLKEEWRPRVDAGSTFCHASICKQELAGGGRRIAPGTPWHLGHTADRTGWTGPEHASCGAADGARRGNRGRGVAKQASRQVNRGRGVAKQASRQVIRAITTASSPLRTSRDW